MSIHKYKEEIAELKAQIEYMNMFLKKTEELNPNIVLPTNEENKLMRYESANKISKETGMHIEFS